VPKLGRVSISKLRFKQGSKVFPTGFKGGRMNCWMCTQAVDIWNRAIVGSTDHHLSDESKHNLAVMASNFMEMGVAKFIPGAAATVTYKP